MKVAIVATTSTKRIGDLIEVGRTKRGYTEIVLVGPHRSSLAFSGVEMLTQRRTESFLSYRARLKVARFDGLVVPIDGAWPFLERLSCLLAFPAKRVMAAIDAEHWVPIKAYYFRALFGLMVAKAHERSKPPETAERRWMSL